MKRYKFHILFALLYGILLFNSLTVNKEKVRNPIWSDAEGYYLYLPAAFVHHGFDFAGLLSTQEVFSLKDRDGAIFTKYTYGVAMMEMPFFLVAHGIVSIGLFNTGGMKPDGYSEPYVQSVSVAAVTYCWLGLIMLFSLLRAHFKEWIAFLTALFILGCTNLYYYTVFECGMSHAYSFFLFACVVFLTPYIWKKNTSRWPLLTCVTVLSLIVFIRPSNAIIGLYPLLYNVYSGKALMARLRNLVYPLNWNHVIASGILALPWIFQLLMWKEMRGDWTIYSYGSEGFNYWYRPKILNVWFDVQNGLFVYSPGLLLSVLGIFFLARKRLFSAPAVIITFLLASYIFGSWHAWWFGAAFGHRSFIEFYTLLFFPSAYIFSKAFQQGTLIKITLSFFAILALYYSIGMSYLYESPWDGVDWTWKTFMDTAVKLF